MSAEFPFVLTRAAVERIERVSPTFSRVTFGASGFAQVGNPGAVLDQRIKLIFPSERGSLPELGDVGADWYQSWLALPEHDRGSMRTYSIRELAVDGDTTRLVIDFVLHLKPGASGPASRWADAASVGDELLILAPRRGRTDGGGIEYAPGDAGTVLLAGDETAAPAIARILEDVDRDVRGVAFIEVPDAGDELTIDAPAGVELRWLTRAEREHGTQLIPAVLRYLGATATTVEIRDTGTEELVWETPRWSTLGE